MEQLSEEHSKLLLSKEWLVKNDNQKSTPYLIKFYSPTVDLSCVVLVTDTKSAWAEVLSGKEIARRWRAHNATAAPFYDSSVDENAWRTSCLELLARAHTLGGITQLSFDIVDSNYSDLALELECEAFKWRWETNFLGHKQSAEIISKHLVMPLISVNHLAFASADPVCELPDEDLEKAVDKLGRTARRTVDTHIRNAISKPRVATTLRRMTAMFNFIQEPPPIRSTADKPELNPVMNAQPRLPPTNLRSISPPPAANIPDLSSIEANNPISLPVSWTPPNRPVTNTSATESDNDESPAPKGKPSVASALHSSSQSQLSVKSPIPSSSKQPKVPVSDDDSSPHRSTKKAKLQASSSDDDEDSEAERRRRIAQLKKGTGAGTNRQGARQPVKRGGKRF